MRRLTACILSLYVILGVITNMSGSVLPPHLRGAKHWDWAWPLSRIPRAWTSFDLGKPTQILGNQTAQRTGSPAPIGEPGSWQFSIFKKAPILCKLFGWYFAISFKARGDRYWHIRVGARYDDVDNYTTFPTIARRQYSITGSQDTSTGPDK